MCSWEATVGREGRVAISLVPSPMLERWVWHPVHSKRDESLNSITSAVQNLDRQCDWLIMVLHYQVGITVVVGHRSEHMDTVTVASIW